MKTAVLVLAAGRGERLGGDIPKAFVPLLGRSLIERSLRAMLGVSAIDRVQPVVAPKDLGRYRTRVHWDEPRLAEPVAGGERRQDSVAAGLEALPAEIEFVLVHDAARCLVRREAIERVLEVGRKRGAALLAIPAPDTVKQVREGVVEATPARENCWLAQTPQVFRRNLLAEGLAKARSEGFQATDDSQLVERLGVAVHIVRGDPDNLKITLVSDLDRAETWLRAREQGQ